MQEFGIHHFTHLRLTGRRDLHPGRTAQGQSAPTQPRSTFQALQMESPSSSLLRAWHLQHPEESGEEVGISDILQQSDFFIAFFH